MHRCGGNSSPSVLASSRFSLHFFASAAVRIPVASGTPRTSVKPIPEDTPRPRPSMMAPILAHMWSSPFWATAVASCLCKCRRYLVGPKLVLLVAMMICMPMTAVVAMTIVWFPSLQIRSQHRRWRYRQTMASNNKTSDIQRWPC